MHNLSLSYILWKKQKEIFVLLNVFFCAESNCCWMINHNRIDAETKIMQVILNLCVYIRRCSTITKTKMGTKISVFHKQNRKTIWKEHCKFYNWLHLYSCTKCHETHSSRLTCLLLVISFTSYRCTYFNTPPPTHFYNDSL